MSTITSKEIIQTMPDNNGTYPGDPQVQSIWEYENLPAGTIMWAFFMNVSQVDLVYSEYVGEYCLLWSKEADHVNTIGALKRPGTDII